MSRAHRLLENRTRLDEDVYESLELRKIALALKLAVEEEKRRRAYNLIQYNFYRKSLNSEYINYFIINLNKDR